MHSQIGLHEPTSTKRKIHLLINYFNPKNQNRQLEINQCLRVNTKLKAIHQVHILIGPGVAPPDWVNNPKLNLKISRVSNNRMTYQGFFDYANEHLPKRSIAVIVNADIACTPSIKQLRRYITSKQCVVLRRWEYINKEWTLIPINSSQDLWAFQTPIKLNEPATFELGVPGCDNYIAWLLSQNYTLKNPARSVVTYHIHKSHKRAYGPRLKGKIKRINIE